MAQPGPQPFDCACLKHLQAHDLPHRKQGYQLKPFPVKCIFLKAAFQWGVTSTALGHFCLQHLRLLQLSNASQACSSALYSPSPHWDGSAEQRGKRWVHFPPHPAERSMKWAGGLSFSCGRVWQGMEYVAVGPAPGLAGVRLPVSTWQGPRAGHNGWTAGRLSPCSLSLSI